VFLSLVQVNANQLAKHLAYLVRVSGLVNVFTLAA
jgi:hypothetical protein